MSKVNFSRTELQKYIILEWTDDFNHYSLKFKAYPEKNIVFKKYTDLICCTDIILYKNKITSTILTFKIESIILDQIKMITFKNREEFFIFIKNKFEYYKELIFTENENRLETDDRVWSLYG